MSTRFSSTVLATLTLIFVGCATPSKQTADSTDKSPNTTKSESTKTDSSRQQSSDSAPTSRPEPPSTDDLAKMTRGINGEGALVVTIHTTEGNVDCRLHEQKAPVTVANFVGLARGKKSWRDPEDHERKTGVPFYDGLSFYRVIPGFIVQAGAPDGHPDAGPGYTLPDEFHPELTHDRPGVMGMASQGPDTAGSQFYITLRAAPHLDAHHPIFGQCRDIRVLSRIAKRPADANNRPEHPARIKKMTFKRRPWNSKDNSE